MKEKNKITKENVIKSIAKKTDKTIYETKEFYEAFEDVLFDYLLTTNENTDVCIKLFEGVSLNAEFVPAQEKKNNLTGKVSLVESRIKPKFKITRSYCEKLNSN